MCIGLTQRKKGTDRYGTCAPNPNSYRRHINKLYRDFKNEKLLHILVYEIFFFFSSVRSFMPSCLCFQCINARNIDYLPAINNILKIKIYSINNLETITIHHQSQCRRRALNFKIIKTSTQNYKLLY